MRKLARALHGSARLADQEAIAASAESLQALGEQLASGQRAWGPALRANVEARLGALRRSVEAVGGGAPQAALRVSLSEFRPAAVEGPEIAHLKEAVRETGAQREVAWISELFMDGPGPHLLGCPRAGEGPLAWEEFFTREAAATLDRIERMRAELAGAGALARQPAEKLAACLRQLRERAVTFGHAELARVVRRADGLVHAAAQAPPPQLRRLARRLAAALTEIRAYLGSQDATQRQAALVRAEDSLAAVGVAVSARTVDIGQLTYTAEEALVQAGQLTLRAHVLLSAPEPDVRHAHVLVEEALGLIEHAIMPVAASRP